MEFVANRSVFQVHGFGQKVYANCGLVGVVKTVVHEPGDQRSLANCRGKEKEMRNDEIIIKYLEEKNTNQTVRRERPA